MIDLEKDLRITPEDVRIQREIRRRRRPTSLDDYLRFLRRMNETFPEAPARRRTRKPVDSRFEL